MANDKQLSSLLVESIKILSEDTSLRTLDQIRVLRNYFETEHTKFFD